ncbi:unnamed protein product, partial [Ectocarpus sp. 12 AP-2014]
GGYVVLDIGDPVGPTPVRTGLSTIDDQGSDRARPSKAVAAVLPLLGSDPAARLLIGNRALPGAPKSQENEVIGDADFADTPRPREDAPTALDQSARALQEQISRAATQGLIDVDPDALREIAEQSETPGARVIDGVPVNIRATTSVDRDMTLVPSAQALSSETGYCIEPARIDI